MAPLPKIVERKLGKHHAVGLCHGQDSLIEIDPRLKPYDYLGTLVHELIHSGDFSLSETQVQKITQRVTAGLWRCGVRRVYL